MGSAAPPKEAWSEWGGDGRPLVFAHANGFPPATYRMALEELSRRFSVTAFTARSLWPDSEPTDTGSWYDLAGDLRRAMVQRGLRQVIGVGHSLGGVLSIVAAATDPTLFRALALVDPVVFTGWKVLFWGVQKNLGFGHRLPLARGARRRRHRFPDLDAVRTAYAGKSVFSTWDPQALEDYVQAGFRETEDGDFVLRYSKAWEARIFELTPASVWPELRRVAVPMLFIRGVFSDTFTAAAAERVKRELPHATVLELGETSHFLPMERAKEVASKIIDWHRGLGV